MEGQRGWSTTESAGCYRSLRSAKWSQHEVAEERSAQFEAVTVREATGGAQGYCVGIGVCVGEGSLRGGEAQLDAKRQGGRTEGLHVWQQMQSMSCVAGKRPTLESFETTAGGYGTRGCELEP